MAYQLNKAKFEDTGEIFDFCDSEARNHMITSEIHVDETDRNRWDNKSDFSGNYNDLTNKPTGRLVIGDLVYDGSEDVTVPVYAGEYNIS